ncbi:tetraspanin-33 isoform X3 [Tyto alba]|uniref:tetraspanin-33 isoform X3 n=1 Tax=Tyto alba TaxID=56313 RepID=UPI001C68667A|nr:tetraspanin-33 isoform X3 [Tyto alba]
MARRAGGGAGPPGDDFSFVSPTVKYVLFFFNTLFWVISMVMVAVGVYARLLKHAEAALACLAVDPAVLLVAVGVLTFLITFCGCVGSLRENICLLQAFCICLTVVFLLQLAAGVLGFVFSDKFSCCGGVSYKDWSQNIYFNCTAANPSRERCSVPFSCCLRDAEQAVVNTLCGRGVQSRSYLEAGAFIYTNGCIDKLVNWIHSNLFLLGGIALGLALPQVPAGPSSWSSSWRSSSRPSSPPLPLPHSWWASCWLRSSSTRSKTRSSCSSTTSNTGQTLGTEPACPSPQRRGDAASTVNLLFFLFFFFFFFPNAGSVGRAEGVLLEKREVGEGRWGFGGLGSRCCVCWDVPCCSARLVFGGGGGGGGNVTEPPPVSRCLSVRGSERRRAGRAWMWASCLSVLS